jgi:hypothetical protein
MPSEPPRREAVAGPKTDERGLRGHRRPCRRVCRVSRGVGECGPRYGKMPPYAGLRNSATPPFGCDPCQIRRPSAVTSRSLTMARSRRLRRDAWESHRDRLSASLAFLQECVPPAATHRSRIAYSWIPGSQARGLPSAARSGCHTPILALTRSVPLWVAGHGWVHLLSRGGSAGGVLEVKAMPRRVVYHTDSRQNHPGRYLTACGISEVVL